MEFVVRVDEEPQCGPATVARIHGFFRQEELWYGAEAWLTASDGVELVIACVAEAVTRPSDAGEFYLTLIEGGIRHHCHERATREEAERAFLQFSIGDRANLSQLEWHPPRSPLSPRPAI